MPLLRVAFLKCIPAFPAEAEPHIQIVPLPELMLIAPQSLSSILIPADPVPYAAALQPAEVQLPPPITMLPPFDLMEVPYSIVTPPDWSALESALKMTCSALVLPPSVASIFLVPLTMMSLSARSFKVRLAPRSPVTSMLASIVMSPLLPAKPEQGAPVQFPAPAVSSVTSLLSRALAIALPEMFPAKSAIVMSTGSISHSPVLPCVARVVIFTSSFTMTRAAEVSMKPPSPPLGALASSLPPTSVSPCSMSERSRILPAWFFRVRASIVPVLLTTALVSSCAALAVIMTMPPSALISPSFAARASTDP